MPTRAGFLVLAVSATVGVFARVLGGIEFFVPTIAGVSAVILAMLLRYLSPSQVTIRKRVTPQFVPAGESVMVHIEVANTNKRRSPLMRFHDAIEGTAGYALNVAPLAAKTGTTSASYRFHADNRGLYDLGPLSIYDLDPLGLVQRKHKIPSTVRLIVHPHLEPIPALPVRFVGDPFTGQQHKDTLGLQDEDFNGLRPYTPGDDLRRVHWLSSARQDELQVRQHRPPHHGLLSVIIDTRPPGHTPTALDVTTSIAASIAAAVLAANDAVLIETTDNRATSEIIGSSQLINVLEFLAPLAEGADSIHANVPSSNSTIIAVSANPSLANDSEKRYEFAQRLRAQLVITTDTQRWGTNDSGHRGPGWIHLSGPNQLHKFLIPGIRRTAVRA